MDRWTVRVMHLWRIWPRKIPADMVGAMVTPLPYSCCHRSGPRRDTMTLSRGVCKLIKRRVSAGTQLGTGIASLKVTGR